MTSSLIGRIGQLRDSTCQYALMVLAYAAPAAMTDLISQAVSKAEQRERQLTGRDEARS